MLVALLAGGCAPRARPGVAVSAAPGIVPGAGASAATGVRAGASAATGVRAVAVATAPVQLLPDTTAVVLSIAGIDALLAVVDVDALVAKFRPIYEQGATLLTGTFGANLLDPAQWSMIGVDPRGPMGAALVDVRASTFVAYATISDPARLRGFIDRVAGEPLLSVFEDRGLVLKDDADSSSAVVLRDGFVFLVVTERPDEATIDMARLLATIDPARGLAASARYQQAIAGGAPAPGLSAYVDPWALLQAERDRLATPRSEPSWAEQELEAARASGAEPDVVAGLSAQIKREHEWERGNLERRARVLELGKRWLGGVSPVVFEFTASASGVVGTIRAKMAEAAALRAVLRNAAEPSPVLMALGERPVLMFGGSVELPVALAEFDEVLRADGEDPWRLYQELGVALKIAEPRREMLELLTGTWGFALTVSDALLRGEGRGDGRDIGFAIGLGVSDEARAEALLEMVWKQVSVAVGKDRVSGARTLEFPDYRTIYAKVVARQLVVTTDVGVIQRIAAGDLKATHRWLEPAVVPVMSARDAAMQGFLDLILAALLVSGRSSSGDDLSEPMQPYWLFEDMKAEQLEKIPRSAAYKAKVREWQAFNAKIRKRNQAKDRTQAQQAVNVARSLGALAGNLREQPDGLVLAGGQMFGKGGLTRAIELMTDYIVPSNGRDEVLHALVEARGRLEREMQEIRAREVATALRVPTPRF